MSKEAMTLALEALENAEYGDYDKKELNKAITALREALAEQQAQQQEPVKREHITDDSSCWCEPETIYKDPETGVSVIVHKEPQ